MIRPHCSTCHCLGIRLWLWRSLLNGGEILPFFLKMKDAVVSKVDSVQSLARMIVGKSWENCFRFCSPQVSIMRRDLSSLKVLRVQELHVSVVHCLVKIGPLEYNEYSTCRPSNYACVRTCDATTYRVGDMADLVATNTRMTRPDRRKNGSLAKPMYSGSCTFPVPSTAASYMVPEEFSRPLPRFPCEGELGKD